MSVFERSETDEFARGARALVIYPEGTYYGHVTLNDVERIVEQHVQNNQILTDLELTF